MGGCGPHVALNLYYRYSIILYIRSEIELKMSEKSLLISWLQVRGPVCAVKKLSIEHRQEIHSE